MDQNLLHKYIVGDALPEEKEKIVKWLKESDDNRELLTQLHHLNDLNVWDTHEIIATKEEKRSLSKISWIVVKVAAVVTMAIMIAHSGYKEYVRDHSVAMQTINVPEGQRASLVLADGTKVWLNSNSTLKFPETGFKEDERRVQLNGEGYFEVAHDVKHPFIVETQKYDVRVLGTSFNVYAYSNTELFETSLVNGKVVVESSSTHQKIELQPNEMLQIDKGVMHKRTFVVDNLFLWREGVYTFDDETFEAIFSKLEKYYEVKIVNKNKQIAGHRCTGKFRQKEGIEQVMKVLQKQAKFNYVRDESKNQIIINN